MLSVLLVASLFQAPQPGGDTIATLLRVERLLRRVGSTSGASIWPGFRPDTIPLLYIFPERRTAQGGSLLMRWKDTAPAGFTRVAGAPGAYWLGSAERGAASTSSLLGERAVAQVVVDSLDAPALLALSAHEAFHVFQRANRGDGKLFGAGENSALTGSYPVFDSTNEAGFAREGLLLAGALRADAAAVARAPASPNRNRITVPVLPREGRPADVARNLGAQFAAVRAARHAALPKNLAEFDAAAELNEGLADYAQLRAAQAAARLLGGDWAVSATRRHEALLSALDSLIGHPERSVRLRFYRTGTALALLLDQLDPGWKRRMLANNWTLEQTLARAVQYDAARAPTLLSDADATTSGAAPMRLAVSNIGRLRERRRILVDSVLSQPGLRVIIELDSLPSKGHGLCGFDPQNMLSTGGPRILHTRFVHPCEQGLFDAVFTTATVHDSDANTLTAVLPVRSDVRLTVAGAEGTLLDGGKLDGVVQFKLESKTLTLQAARATVQRSANELRIRPLAR